MKALNKTARILSFLVISGVAVAPNVDAQNAPLSSVDTNTVPPLIRQMVGTWSVEQRMWPGSGAAAIDLPPAVALRRLIGGAFLQEVMELAPTSAQEPFSRIAYFNYNAVIRQYEYFSMDTRAPQTMNERSDESGANSTSPEQGAMTPHGASSWRRAGATPRMSHSSTAWRLARWRQIVRWSSFT